MNVSYKQKVNVGTLQMKICMYHVFLMMHINKIIEIPNTGNYCWHLTVCMCECELKRVYVCGKVSRRVKYLLC